MRPLTYLKTLWNTCTSPQYYIDILNAKLSFSLRFFLMSHVLLAICAYVFFTVTLAPNYQLKLSQSLAELKSRFPQNLTLAWNGTQLTTTPSDRLEVPYPTALKDFKNEALPPQLGLLDTKISNVDDAKLTGHPSLFVVTNSSLYLAQYDSGWSKFPLREVPGFDQSFTITKDSLATYLPTWQTQGENWIRVLSLLLPVGWIVIFAPLRLVGLIAESLLIFFFLRISGKQLPYRKIYQLALHIAIVAEVVHLFSTYIVKVELPMFSITFWLYFAIIMLQMSNVIQIPLGKSDEQRR